jgi:exodeoxyribonuclease VII large subunit
MQKAVIFQMKLEILIIMIDKEKTYKVSDINQIIKEIIEGSCPYPIWVQGELSDFDKNARRDHIYFQLTEKNKEKDEAASTIKCVLYQSSKEIIRSRLREAGMKIKKMDGLEVRIMVRLSASVRYGSYSLRVEDIDPSFTLGQLAQNREESIKWLQGRGLVEKNKRLDLVDLPLRIGLITNEGEGYHDFVEKLKSSDFGFTINFYRANVQGAQTEKEIIAGLEFFKNNSEKIDVVVITRGGGASTDLAWFDSRKIAEAIALSSNPVLTGIGHHTNVSVADLVAHLYFSTPTAVAEFLLEKAEKFVLKIDKYSETINRQSEHVLILAEKMIDNHVSSIKYLGENACYYQSNKIESWQQEISRLMGAIIKRERGRQLDFEHKVRSLDPVNIMKRGFSLTTYRGQLVKDGKTLKTGDILETSFLRGKVKSSIIKK